MPTLSSTTDSTLSRARKRISSAMKSAFGPYHQTEDQTEAALDTMRGWLEADNVNVEDLLVRFLNLYYSSRLLIGLVWYCWRRCIPEYLPTGLILCRRQCSILCPISERHWQDQFRLTHVHPEPYSQSPTHWRSEPQPNEDMEQSPCNQSSADIAGAECWSFHDAWNSKRQ